MGSLSITPFSCIQLTVHQKKVSMGVFATLTTILGVAYATPNAQIQQSGQMGPLRSALQQHNVMPSSTDNVMPNMRMSTSYQAQTGPTPNQYHLQDKFGNFEYAWKNQDSEKMEKGNDMSVRGRYAYIMSDGKQRRVEYIADNNVSTSSKTTPTTAELKTGTSAQLSRTSS